MAQGSPGGNHSSPPRAASQCSQAEGRLDLLDKQNPGRNQRGGEMGARRDPQLASLSLGKAGLEAWEEGARLQKKKGGDNGIQSSSRKRVISRLPKPFEYVKSLIRGA